jgi:hypothetical protein
MNLPARPSWVQNLLRSRGRKPIEKVRLMQINGVSSSAVPAVFLKLAPSPQGTAPAGDQVSMSTSAEAFSSLVSQVGQMPEVRGEIVDAYKARVAAGYPGPLDVEGLANLMGPTWIRNAVSAGSAE